MDATDYYLQNAEADSTIPPMNKKWDYLHHVWILVFGFIKKSL